MCVPSLVLIAQVVFLLEHGHTTTHTQSHVPLNNLLMHRLPPAWVIGPIPRVVVVVVVDIARHLRYSYSWRATVATPGEWQRNDGS